MSQCNACGSAPVELLAQFTLGMNCLPRERMIEHARLDRIMVLGLLVISEAIHGVHVLR